MARARVSARCKAEGARSPGVRRGQPGPGAARGWFMFDTITDSAASSASRVAGYASTLVQQLRARPPALARRPRPARSPHAPLPLPLAYTHLGHVLLKSQDCCPSPSSIAERAARQGHPRCALALGPRHLCRQPPRPFTDIQVPVRAISSYVLISPSNVLLSASRPAMTSRPPNTRYSTRMLSPSYSLLSLELCVYNYPIMPLAHLSIDRNSVRIRRHFLRQDSHHAGQLR